MIVIPALPGFRARHPDLHVDLGVTDRSIDLIGGGVDCVIRGGELGDTSLVARRIAELDWVTCASPRYLEARGVPRHPSELMERDPGGERPSGHDIMGYFSSLTGKTVPLEFRKGDERVVVQGRAGVAVNESTAHLSSLLSGLGIGQAFRFAAAPHLQAGTLRSILDDWSRPRHRCMSSIPAIATSVRSSGRSWIGWRRCSPPSTTIGNAEGTAADLHQLRPSRPT